MENTNSGKSKIVNDVMTSSYSEILDDDLSPGSSSIESLTEHDDRQLGSTETLANLAAHGTITTKGDLVCFVAKNLEEKIRMSSPSDEIPTAHQAFLRPSPRVMETSMSQTVEFLNKIEGDARRVASAVDSLMEQLGTTLHQISAVTSESLDVYKDSVCKACDLMDSNIKNMYQLIAKCEEANQAMVPIYKYVESVKETKKLVDLLESVAFS
ncbi:hypothetical protein QYM36_019392 [Artemia franciscana]|uniref:BLOC-1-related complex subunit 6 C-terminal helix domain-containing protein n=2 Tax=Artemia franciscana TaxID=6661 RepID=A0AA88H7E0_ARTSF|nr:hypothetical protein QYM36_019392 [Artemia franciscana]